MQAIAAEYARRRVRARDFFQDFDHLRSGRVTFDQFRRVLAVTDVMKLLKPSEVDSIAAAYAEGDTIRYDPFLSDVEEIQNQSVSPHTRSSSTIPKPGTTLYRIFEICVQQSHATGLDPRHSFQPFDKHNSGTVSASQFDRCFPFRVDPADVATVKQPYITVNGDVNYLGFCTDLKAMMEQRKSIQSATNGEESTGSKPAPLLESPWRQRPADGSDVSLTLRELKYHLQKEQVNISDAFRDFDRLRSGVVSSGQFTSALGRVVLRGFVLSSDALGYLVGAYRVDGTTDRVAYTRFLHDLDEAPRGGPQLHLLPEVEMQRLEVVLNKVRTTIRTRRVNIKPIFQDFDRANKGIYLGLTCTRSRFERVLAVNGIHLSVAEVDLLERRFAIKRPTESDTDAIDYIAFCREVDLPDATLQSPPVVRQLPTFGQGTYNATTGTTLIKKDPTLAAVIDVALIQIADRSIRLQEFIRDHDPLRSGTISRTKLEMAISVSGLRLEPDQVKTLLDAYASKSDPQIILYPQLLEALDTDAPGLDPSLHKVDEARARVTAEVQATAASMHSEHLDLILQRIRDDVAARHILLPPFFQDYDKHHRGTITATQFERTITRHRLPVSTADIAVLKQYFADPADANNVRCRDFIAAVDAAEAARLPKYLRQAPTRSEAQGAAGNTLPANEHRCSLSDVLAKISGFVLTRGLRIAEFFRDADPLRKGYCHSSRFIGALNVLGIALTESEDTILIDTYRSQRAPNSVDYDRFVAEIEALEHQKAMGATDLNTADGTILKSPQPHGDVDKARREVDSDPFLLKVFSGVASYARARRLSVRTILQDYDRLRKGVIPQSQFFSALSANGIKFNALETSKLTELLGTEGKMMRYVIFCRLAEEAP